MEQANAATVRRELSWVAAWTLGLALLMNLLFAVFGAWSRRVLWGTLLGCTAAIGNFWILCLSVTKAVGQDEKHARATVSTSHTLRLLLQAGVLVLAFVLKDVFQPYATLLCLFFPQLAVRLRPLWKKGMEPKAPAEGGDRLD